MQKLILFVSLLLVSSKTFSLNATANNSDPDSLICIPKTTVIKVIQDLKKGDMSEKEIEILNSNLSITNDYVSKQDSIISTLKEKESSYVKTIESHDEITDLNKKTIENLNLTITKERKKTKRWKAICGGVFLGFLLITR